MLSATQPLYPPAGGQPPQYGAAPAWGTAVPGQQQPPQQQQAPVQPILAAEAQPQQLYGADPSAGLIPTQPQPPAAAPRPSAGNDLDEIFGFSAPKPEAAPPQQQPQQLPQPGVPAAYPGGPAPVPTFQPAAPAQPAAAALPVGSAAYPTGLPGAPLGTVAPAAVQPDPVQPSPVYPGVGAGLPGVGAAGSAGLADFGAPAGIPGLGAPAPGAVGGAAPGGLPVAPVQPSYMQGVGAAAPGALPQQPAGGVPNAVQPQAQPFAGATGFGAAPAVPAMPGVAGSAPGVGLPGYGVPAAGGALPGAAGGMGGVRPTYADPAAGAVVPEASFQNELNEAERRQRESQRKIQALRESIEEFRRQNEASAQAREARNDTMQRNMFGQPSQNTQQPQQQQQQQAPPAQPYRGNASDLKADMKRQFSGADDSVVADLAENVMQGQMSQEQAFEMLREMSGAAVGVAQQQERRDEEMARMLQAQEERDAAQPRPPPTQRLSYEGVGGVSRLEQEQRDMALAQEMQDAENKRSQAPAAGPVQSSRAAAHDDWGYGGNSSPSHGGSGYPVSRVAIPSYENRDGNWYFRIDVEGEGGKRYAVYKRYSQFDELQKKVASNVIARNGPPFPPKSVMAKLTSGTDEQSRRRTALQSWLQDLLEKVKMPMCANLRSEMNAFLEVHTRMS